MRLIEEKFLFNVLRETQVRKNLPPVGTGEDDAGWWRFKVEHGLTSSGVKPGLFTLPWR